MKHTYLFMFFLSTLTAAAQNEVGLAANGVYLSDSDYLSHRLKDGFDKQKGCRLNNNRRNYLVVQTINRRDTFYFDEIWGYRKDGEDWRIFQDEAYAVKFNNNKICLYDVPGTGQGEGLRTTHYFSPILSAPVHHLSKHNLLSVYHNNANFIRRLKTMPPGESIYKWDQISHSYKFMKWL